MNRRIILIILFCCYVLSIHAQELQAPEEDTTTKLFEDLNNEKGILSDTLLTVNSITVSPDTINGIKNKKGFGYTKNLDSLLKDWQDGTKNTTMKMPTRSVSFFDGLLSSGILQIILWSLAILFVGFILYHLFLSKGIFKRNSSGKKITADETEEELFVKEDYDALIRQAYKLQDHRMAVRYLFLKTLQRLNQRSLIQFEADKTNSRYVFEVPPEKRNSFAGLVMNYEYVWYGNIAITKEMYDKIETGFSTFFNKI